ncbi:MAG: site-specific integrase [Phycisphaeraceae bacterium]
MATISSYTTTGGKRYRVRYRTPDHRQTDKRGFKTKRDAEAFAATVEVQKLTGEFIPAAAGRITVAELAPAWLTRKEALTAPSNYRMIESAWRVHVKSKWGHWRVNAIDELHVQDWIAEMTGKGSGATTVRRAHGVLLGILNDAVKSRRLAHNPAAGLDELPEKPSRRHLYLNADDVHRLASEAGDHGPLVYLLAFTGVRWGEAIALRVKHIQFLRRRLTIEDNAVQLGVDHAEGRPKGKVSRSVPIPEFVLDRISPLCAEKGLEELVFSSDGKYLPRPKSAGGWFAGAVKRAEVRKITPHDLRHTAASLAVSAGVNVLALQRMLGHKSAKDTLDTYADLFDTDLDAVANTMHATYSPQSVGKVWAGA